METQKHQESAKHKQIVILILSNKPQNSWIEILKGTCASSHCD